MNTAIGENLRDQRLARTVELAAQAHPYYQELFKKVGVEPEDIRSVDDLSALPPTKKSDFIADPEAFRLRPDDLPEDVTTEERVLWDVAYTTGTTTGKPSPFYNTTHDIYAILDHTRRINEAEGVVATDRIANLYPVAGFPTGAFLSVVRSGMIGGVPVVHGLTGSANSEFKVRNSLVEALGKVERFRPTILWGVPSFLRRFLDEAHRRGSDLSDVRMIISSGEPMPLQMRTEIRHLLGKPGSDQVTFRARYACTELQGALVQVSEDAAPQNITPDLYYFETLDADTGRAVDAGEEGALAITHLHRRGTLLFRYLVGDVVRLSRGDTVRDGLPAERFDSTPRRTDDLVKCRGMLVNTHLMLTLLSETKGVGEHQIEFAREDNVRAMDEMIVRVERVSSDETNSESDDFVSNISAKIKGAVSMTPRVEIVPRGSLYDSGKSIKARRVIDSRPIAGD